MASSPNQRRNPSAGGGAKFHRKTTNKDDDSDDMNYTVVMPPTSDNQPGDQSRDKPDGPTLLRSVAHKGDDDQGGDEDRKTLVMQDSENNKSMLMKTQTQEFDHNRWLFESKNGKYGIGNAFYQDGGGFDSETGMNVQDFIDKPWKPLTRKVAVPPGVLSPYRVLIVMRMVVLIFFLSWRLTNPNYDAMWLWGMSVMCEMWFVFSWLLDILPKFNPINRAADLAALKDKFESPTPTNPEGRSDLPGMDVFISTADPEKEPPLVTANTILSVLGAEYPVEKLSIYISDDGGAILTFEAMVEAVKFAEYWVPFCRKHDIVPRNPDSYFSQKVDSTKNKKSPDFVKERRWIKREYDEFKVRINGLPEVIRKRCQMYNKNSEMHEKKLASEKNGGTLPTDFTSQVPKATWMADGTHWPGTWYESAPDHAKGDHAGILQIMSNIPSHDPVMGGQTEVLDFTGIDIRLPMLAYVSREKRKMYDHNKKAGAMNALVRASAILSNGPFILNLDCDHYIYNSMALREGMCYMMDRGGDRICFIQFPQRFEGIDPSDRYANHNSVFFNGNMKALDGLQGPVYVGTGCMFRRYALYGFPPPRAREYSGWFGQKKTDIRTRGKNPEEEPIHHDHPDLNLPQKFGNSTMFTESIAAAEFQGRPLADHFTIKNGRPSGSLTVPRPPIDAPLAAEAIAVISCWYEEKTEWGDRVGWIYGSVTEDVVTGYRMHNRGWRSVYCVTKRDAFRGSAPINLTDRLHQVLRWATGSVEIFFSQNNAVFATQRLKFLQRVAYLNVGIYPFTSIFLVIYCFLPAFSLFSGQLIVQSLDVAFLSYLLIITVLLILISLLEVKWSGISLEEWWRNEQFWAIGGTSAHLVAVIQGLLKVIAGIEIHFTLTSKASTDEDSDIYEDLYQIKWTTLFIMPMLIIMTNLIALVIASMRTIYSVIPQWNKFFGGAFFSFWVLSHMYPFAKGLMGKKGKLPTIIYVWAGLLSIMVSLLWLVISPPQGVVNPQSSEFTL